MNSKILGIIVLVLIIVVAGYLLLGYNKTQTGEKSNDQSQNQTPAKKESAEITTVNVTANGFEPKEIKVKLNTQVVWVNRTNDPANVSSDNHPTHLLFPFLNLGEFDPGSSVQVKFEKPGIYTYHDHLNPQRKGTVAVE